MKLYGAKRKDCQECKYGCCGHKAHYARRGTIGGKAIKKAFRKRARKMDSNETE